MIPDMIDRGQDLMQAQASEAADVRTEVDGGGEMGDTTSVGGVDLELDAADMSLDGAV